MKLKLIGIREYTYGINKYRLNIFITLTHISITRTLIFGNTPIIVDCDYSQSTGAF